MADTQDFIDTLDTTQPLSQLEQARPTANGQNFRAPGFIGNYDRTLLNAAPTPTALPAPAAPQTALGTIGTSDNRDGSSGTSEAPGPANGLAATDSITTGKIGDALTNAGRIAGVVPGVPTPVSLGLTALGEAISSQASTAPNGVAAPANSANPAPNAPGTTPAPDRSDTTDSSNGGTGSSSGGGMGSGGSGQGANGGDPDPGGGADGCFVADTPILMADGSTKPIRDVEVGDIVMAFDGLGPLTPCRVIGKMVHADREVINLGSRVLVTGEHPLLTPAGSWEKAGYLGEGDRIVTADGQPWRIPHAVPQDGKFTVHNIEVDDLHTYVAGGLRVHNKFAMGGIVGGRRVVGPARASSPRFSQRHGIVMAEGGAVPMVNEDRRSGGPVTGPGTWNSDNVTTKTSPGEEVIPANVRAYYGQKFFDDLITNFEQKTGQKRGDDRNGKPPSAEAQRSFQRTQGGDPDNDGDNDGGRPDGDGDDTQQPEASSPPQPQQGAPLLAAGPTMAPVMALGGRVPDVKALGDGDLMQHARMSRARGDRTSHQAASQEIQRRLRDSDDGGDYAKGGVITAPMPQAPRPGGSFRSGAAAAVRVPPVRSIGGAMPAPSVPIATPGPRPQAMPSPPPVIGAGPPQSVAPMAAAPRIASPSASGVPRQPKTALGAIGRF